MGRLVERAHRVPVVPAPEVERRPRLVGHGDGCVRFVDRLDDRARGDGVFEAERRAALVPSAHDRDIDVEARRLAEQLLPAGAAIAQRADGECRRLADGGDRARAVRREDDC